MTLRVQGTISINGAQAKAEAKSVAGELRKVGTDATGMARGVREAASGAKVMSFEAHSAEAKLRALAAAERQAAADAINMGRSHTIGASGVANLTAQFNDIGVMLAAGQNPLQLAIQQGTQITQVFGTMGAGAAVRGLGQALLSMVSPLNLITIGGIAAGAAIVQWLFQAGEEAETLEDALSALTDGTDVYAKANDRATATTAELREEFGAAAEAARELLREEAELARRQAERATRGVSGAVQDQMGLYLDDSRFSVGNQQQLADVFDFSIWDREARGAINGVIGAFRQLDSAGTLEKQISAAETLQERFKEAAEASGGISFEEDSALHAINQLILGLQRLKAEQQAAQAAMAEDNGRFPGFEAAQAALDYRLQEQIAIRESVAAAKEMVATLQAEGQIRSLIAVFGRDSELVAQSRLAIERELVAVQLEAEGIIGAMADRVLEAWDNAKGFKDETAALADLLARAHDAVVAMAAAAPGGGWLAGAIADAATLAGKLFDAAVQARELRGIQQRLAAQGKISSGRGGDPRTSNQQGYGEFHYNGPALDSNNEIIVKKGGSGRSKGDAAAKEAKKERDAVLDLIKTLEREIELERELDPVKRQMIQYREQMAAATAEERAKVEELIVQREREKAATESLKWAGDQAGDSLVDALMGGVDAGERLIETLKRAVLQALLLGNGPLAGLFGGGLFGGGGMGGLGSLLGGGDLFDNIGGLAEGGMVYGPGGPTDDKVPRMLSPGEFVVNARATRRHRHMLEALNDAPGMATGGFVGQGGGEAAMGGSVTIAPVIDARGAHDPAAVEAAARRGMAMALDEYRRTGLPNDIRRSIDSPHVRRF